MVSLTLLSLAALGFASPGDPDPLLLAWPGATVRGAWLDTGPRADAGASAISSAAPDGEGRELITLTCLECHEGDRPEGGLDLAAALADPAAHVAVLTRSVRRVEAGEMPPTGPLAEEEQRSLRADVMGWLGTTPGDPGRPTLRRLTRAQLRQVVQDLLGVDVEVSTYLPRGASAYGFDTTGDVQFLGPLDLERWIELVEAVVGKVAEAVAREGAAITTDPLGGPALTANPERSAAIRSLLSRAFRRPATDAEVQRRVTLVDRALASGCAPQAVTAEVLRSTLLSPSFIFRLEEERPQAPAPWLVDGYELAARLSLFLWGTLPDTQLVADAEAGRLVGEGPARAAADRMLRDPRARWLAEDFAAQWLGFRELEDVTPDVRRFRAFTPALRRDFQLEAEAFFADLVAEDRSVLEILDSNHAFLNDRLAAHYGLAGVGHRDIRRTPIADRRRGGVLGMGAILTVTSTPLRTSPVQRGQWVLERLLGRSAPPPPPDAGSLPEDDRQKDGLSLRERLEAHRAQPACAGCHALFDPYGLALESLDGLGRWRDGRTGEPPISTRVTLPSGSEVDGPVGLKIALRRDPQRFLTTLQRALFTYAIGRPPGLGDDKHLRGALEDAAREDYRFSALVDGIVSSPAFTSRRNP